MPTKKRINRKKQRKSTFKLPFGLRFKGGGLMDAYASRTTKIINILTDYNDDNADTKEYEIIDILKKDTREDTKKSMAQSESKWGKFTNSFTGNVTGYNYIQLNTIPLLETNAPKFSKELLTELIKKAKLRSSEPKATNKEKNFNNNLIVKLNSYFLNARNLNPELKPKTTLQKGYDMVKSEADEELIVNVGENLKLSEEVTKAVSNPASVNNPIPELADNTVLVSVCLSGTIEQFNAILAISGIDINKKSAGGMTPLMAASTRNDDSFVRPLLEKPNIVVDESNDEGNTALHIACKTPQVPVITAILEKSRAITKTNNDGLTPLMILCNNETLSIEAINLLIGKTKQTKEGLNAALDSKKQNVLFHIIEQCANYEISGEHSTKFNSIKPILDNLLDGSPQQININHRDAETKTVLYNACDRGEENSPNSELIAYLLEKNAKADIGINVPRSFNNIAMLTEYTPVCAINDNIKTFESKVNNSAVHSAMAESERAKLDADLENYKACLEVFPAEARSASCLKKPTPADLTAKPMVEEAAPATPVAKSGWGLFGYGGKRKRTKRRMIRR